MKLVIFNTFAALIEWQTKFIPKQNSYISGVDSEIRKSQGGGGEGGLWFSR